MGLARLAALENRLRSLQNDLNSYKKQLDQQQRRKRTVEDIIRTMINVCNDRTSDVNGRLNKIIEEVEYAMVNIGNPSGNIISSQKEKGVEGDADMNIAYQNIRDELNDINILIDNLNGKIASTSNQINECSNSIRIEKSSIAQSYRSSFINAKNRFDAADRAYRLNPTEVGLKMERDRAYKKYIQSKAEYQKYAGWL